MNSKQRRAYKRERKYKISIPNSWESPWSNPEQYTVNEAYIKANFKNARMNYYNNEIIFTNEQDLIMFKLSN